MKLTRNTFYTFTVPFFEDDAQTIPLVQADASSYPAYEIRDLDNLVTHSGVMVPSGENPPGFWDYRFFVPEDSKLTTDDGTKWRFSALFVAVNGRQETYTQEFEIVEVAVTESSDRSLTILAMPGEDERVFIRKTKSQNFIKLDVFDDALTKVVDGAVEGEGAGKINKIIDNGTYIYYFDLLGAYLIEGREYQLVWTTRETAASVSVREFQILRVPPQRTFFLFPGVRQIVDKLQKKAGTIQAYSDSDIFEYLKNGVSFINAFHPATQWTFNTFPYDALQYQLLTASSIAALNAQQILESELAFDFSGQTITLSRNIVGEIEGAIQRMVSFLEMTIPPVKKPLYRRSYPTALVAVRNPRYQSAGNFVYRISGMHSQDLPRLLSQFGLL